MAHALTLPLFRMWETGSVRPGERLREAESEPEKDAREEGKRGCGETCLESFLYFI